MLERIYYTAIGMLIGTGIIAIPYSYVKGKEHAEGISQEYIIMAQKCDIELRKLKELIADYTGEIQK